MNKQKAILNRLAKEHGITIGQAEEIWKLLVDKIAITISDPDKKGEDNTFVQFVGDPDNPTVYRKQDDSWDKWTWRVGVDHYIT